MPDIFQAAVFVMQGAEQQTRTELQVRFMGIRQNPKPTQDQGRSPRPVNGSETWVTNAMGYNPSRYTVLRGADDVEYHENVGADGATNRTWMERDGTTTALSPDNTLVVSRQGPDPRWGLQAPIPQSSSITLPSGKKMTTTSSSFVGLTDPNNPLSLVAQTNFTTINGQTFASLYLVIGGNRTVTTFSPLGRTSTPALDAKGRVIESSVPGIAPVGFQYDSRGRLETVSQTADSQTRTVSYLYDQSQNGGAASGRLVGIVDTLNRTNSFTYDPNLSGRVTRQTFPNGRYIEFE